MSLVTIAIRVAGAAIAIIDVTDAITVGTPVAIPVPRAVILVVRRCAHPATPAQLE